MDLTSLERVSIAYKPFDLPFTPPGLNIWEIRELWCRKNTEKQKNYTILSKIRRFPEQQFWVILSGTRVYGIKTFLYWPLDHQNFL